MGPGRKPSDLPDTWNLETEVHPSVTDTRPPCNYPETVQAGKGQAEINWILAETCSVMRKCIDEAHISMFSTTQKFTDIINRSLKSYLKSSYFTCKTKHSHCHIVIKLKSVLSDDWAVSKYIHEATHCNVMTTCMVIQLQIKVPYIDFHQNVTRVKI